MTDKNVSIMNIGSMGYLPQVFKKIENEKKLNIVYLGGSITMGCNATKTELRYVDRSAKCWYWCNYLAVWGGKSAGTRP